MFTVKLENDIHSFCMDHVSNRGNNLRFKDLVAEFESPEITYDDVLAACKTLANQGLIGRPFLKVPEDELDEFELYVATHEAMFGFVPSGPI